jgi:hypothetical protein
MNEGEELVAGAKTWTKASPLFVSADRGEQPQQNYHFGLPHVPFQDVIADRIDEVALLHSFHRNY